MNIAMEEMRSYDSFSLLQGYFSLARTDPSLSAHGQISKSSSITAKRPRS